MFLQEVQRAPDSRNSPGRCTRQAGQSAVVRKQQIQNVALGSSANEQNACVIPSRCDSLAILLRTKNLGPSVDTGWTKLALPLAASATTQTVGSIALSLRFHT